MACPIIDGIDWNDMHYSSVYGSGRNHQRGIFEWGLLYKESKVPRKELKSRDHESEPYRFVVVGIFKSVFCDKGDLTCMSLSTSIVIVISHLRKKEVREIGHNKNSLGHDKLCEFKTGFCLGLLGLITHFLFVVVCSD